MPRVIFDAVRRLLWAWVILLAILTTVWVLALRPGVATTFARFPYAFSFYVDLFVCLQLRAGPDSPLRLRLVHTLPVRRADLGAGAWLLAVLGSGLVATCAKILAAGIVRAMWIVTPVDLSWVMFSGIFDLAYVGAMWWLHHQVVRTGFAIGLRRGKALLYWLLGASAALYIGGTLALARYMPTGWAEWRWHTGPLLAGLLAMTVASYFHATRHAVLGVRSLFGIRSASPARGADVAAAPPRVPFVSRLSVLRRMLWQQFRSAAIVSVVLVGLLVLAAGADTKAHGLLNVFRQGVSALPAEGGAQIWPLAWILSLGIGMSRWQPSKLPVLRTLPISSREINVILLTRTAVTCMAFWLALLPIYALSPAATHPWMGFGWLTSLIGVTAVGIAAWVRWHRLPLTTFVPMAINYLLMWTHPWTHIRTNIFAGDFGQLVALTLGVAGIALAFMWNRRLLTQIRALFGRVQSSVLFRPAQ